MMSTHKETMAKLDAMVRTEPPADSTPEVKDAWRKLDEILDIAAADDDVDEDVDDETDDDDEEDLDDDDLDDDDLNDDDEDEDDDLDDDEDEDEVIE